MTQRIVLRNQVLQIIFLSLGLSLLVAQPASAELAANAAVTSNYVFRGESQSDGKPALQGGIDWNHEQGFYAGAWGSTVKETCDDRPAGSQCGSSNPQGSGIEVDLYGGWAYQFSDNFGIDLGYILYEYSDSDFSSGAREWYAGINFGFFNGTFYSGDDQNANPVDYTYIDLGVDLELQEDVLLSFHYGRKDPDTGKAVNDVRAEVAKEILGFDMGVAVTYEDGTDNLTTSKDTEFYVTIKKVFELQ